MCDATHCAVYISRLHNKTTHEHGSAKINQRQNMIDAVDGNAQQHNYVRQRLNLMLFFTLFLFPSRYITNSFEILCCKLTSQARIFAVII